MSPHTARTVVVRDRNLKELLDGLGKGRVTKNKPSHGKEKGRASVKEAALKTQFSTAHDAKELGNLVREIRKAAGLSQTQLAAAMGTSQGAITRLESGNGSPTLETLRKVADATNTNLSINFT